MAAVTICSDFGAQKNKVCHCFHYFSICHEVMGPDAMIWGFWMLSFKPTLSLSSFTFIKRLLSSSSLSAIRVVSSSYLKIKKVKSLNHAQLFVTPWIVAYQASLIYGIFQARILKWVAISFSRVSSQPRDWTWVSCIIGRWFYHLSHQGRSAYLRLLIFLPAILIPACASSSPAFLMMYFAYKLNKHGDNIQPWRTPFPTWD